MENYDLQYKFKKLAFNQAQYANRTINLLSILL